jgi:hypothetical protein
MSDTHAPTLPEVAAELARMEAWAAKQFLVLPESEEGQYIEALRKAKRRLEGEASPGPCSCACRCGNPGIVLTAGGPRCRGCLPNGVVNPSVGPPPTDDEIRAMAAGKETAMSDSAKCEACGGELPCYGPGPAAHVLPPTLCHKCAWAGIVFGPPVPESITLPMTPDRVMSLEAGMDVVFDDGPIAITLRPTPPDAVAGPT